jgi:hypothetical protein
LRFLKLMDHQCLVVSVKLEQEIALDLGPGNIRMIILKVKNSKWSTGIVIHTISVFFLVRSCCINFKELSYAELHQESQPILSLVNLSRCQHFLHLLLAVLMWNLEFQVCIIDWSMQLDCYFFVRPCRLVN